MGFKRNITITLACVITECLISLIPTIFIIYVFFMMDKMGEIFSTLLGVPYFILIINVILIIISFISQIFIKTKYYIKDECLVIKTKTKIKEINYDEIVGIVYDFGNYLNRYSKKSSQLMLFDKEDKQLLFVNNPSIIMVHLIKKKCKHAKVSYYNNKRFLFFLLLINGIILLISILVKLFT